MEGGWSPSSASRTPAFWRDSLYFIMAATAAGAGVAPGAAFSYPFGIISIMNRMGFSFLCLARLGCRLFVQLAKFTFAAAGYFQEILGQLDRLLLRSGLDDRETANHFFGFRERAVGDREFSVVGKTDTRAERTGEAP